MIDFKGLADWFEVFSGGKQVDDMGRVQDGDWLIDRAIETFNPQYHEPPVVIGHPKDNAPAFAWVEGLKTAIKNGKKVLLAKCKDIQSEFEQMVKEGLFKKRSASFYRDGRLRHIGFLGAATPSVKGLADLNFDDGGDAIMFEFNEDVEFIEAQRDRMIGESIAAKVNGVKNSDVIEWESPEFAEALSDQMIGESMAAKVNGERSSDLTEQKTLTLSMYRDQRLGESIASRVN